MHMVQQGPEWADGVRGQRLGTWQMDSSVFHGPPWWDGVRQCVGQRAPFLSWSQPDTLLNVFLAIAVDNLANAQELTKVCRNTTCSLEGTRRSGTQHMLLDTCGVTRKVSSWVRVHVTSGESP